MNAEQMREKFDGLYDMMASNKNVAYMRTFGNVHREMMDWMIQNKPDLAEEWLEKLESIKWRNYLTPKEAEKVVSGMQPKAPWTKDQWRQAMEQKGYDLENEPFYNSCALWAVMNMVMSDSSATLEKFVAADKLFDAVYSLAIDKLKDKDVVFTVRENFGV